MTSSPSPEALTLLRAAREPLPAQVQAELLERYASTRDKKAHALLVAHNLRLVAKVALDYARWYHFRDQEDLVQQGTFGLLRALELFDPAYGVRFTTYAGPWIRAHVLHYLVSNYGLLRVGSGPAARKLFFDLQGARRKIEALGGEATPAALAAALGVLEEDVTRHQGATTHPVSLTALESAGTLPWRDQPEPELGRLVDEVNRRRREAPADLDEAIYRGQIVARVRSLDLDPRETLILEKRLLGGARLKDLGAVLGLSRERVRQLESRLLSRLRAVLTEGALEP